MNTSEIDICREWIRIHGHQTESIQKEYSSYAYKHIVEYWLDSLGTRKYIYEGAFIKAATLEGYQYDDGYFNMCVPSISWWHKLIHWLFH